MLIGDLPTAFVDLETTGASSRGNGITEIAVVRVSANGEVDEWSSLVNPGREIPLTISALTGIHDDMVAAAPTFADLAVELRERLAGHVFAAHNVRFDYGFLHKAFASLDMPFRPRKLCTVQLSRQLYPKERYHGLDALMTRHALTCVPRHRALTDARALHEWCTKVAAELGLDALRTAATEQLAGPALPAGMHSSDVTRLTDGPGVYRFFGSDDALLYVGKSVNVRGRVLAHFGAANRDPRERRLFEQTQRVEATPTAGELGALLLEVQTIKQAEPVYNRRLRHRACVYTLALDTSSDYHVPRAIRVEDDALPTDSYGLYRQKSGAQRALKALADEHNLCRKRLALERGAGSCFGYQVGKCRGACVGKQIAVAWNLSLREALGPTRLTPWPYDGPIAIGEARGRRRTWHVVDRWCLLGSAARRDDFDALLHNETHFDIDIFRILEKNLARSAHRLTIVEL